jgi:hypothetical protein
MIKEDGNLYLTKNNKYTLDFNVSLIKNVNLIKKYGISNHEGYGNKNISYYLNDELLFYVDIYSSNEYVVRITSPIIPFVFEKGIIGVNDKIHNIVNKFNKYDVEVGEEGCYLTLEKFNKVSFFGYFTNRIPTNISRYDICDNTTISTYTINEIILSSHN